LRFVCNSSIRTNENGGNKEKKKNKKAVQWCRRWRALHKTVQSSMDKHLIDKKKKGEGKRNNEIIKEIIKGSIEH
jgi:hypothetical protein